MSRLHRLLRKPFFGRFEVPWVWPANAEPAHWERVSIARATGGYLAGLWAEAYGDAKATLVLAHPMGKAAKAFWLRYGHAELFRQAGFNVLVFDANGFGESDAHSFDYPSDILAAGLWAQARTPSLSIGLVGASFGAGWGLCAMAKPNSPYRAAVLEAAFPTLPEFWRHYPAAYFTLRLSQLLWPSLERNLRPEYRATQAVGKPPVLLIYGDADKYTPPVHGERLQKAFSQVTQAELVVISGVDHTYAYRDAKDVYAEKVITFLNKTFSTFG